MLILDHHPLLMHSAVYLINKEYCNDITYPFSCDYRSYSGLFLVFKKKKYENKGKVLKTAYTYLSLIGFIAFLDIIIFSAVSRIKKNPYIYLGVFVVALCAALFLRKYNDLKAICNLTTGLTIYLITTILMTLLAGM